MVGFQYGEMPRTGNHAFKGGDARLLPERITLNLELGRTIISQLGGFSTFCGAFPRICFFDLRRLERACVSGNAGFLIRF